MGFKMNGFSQVRETVKAKQNGFKDRVAQGLYHQASIEKTEAVRRTPVWNPARPVPKGHVPGLLRASAHVEEPRFEGNTVSIDIVYSGNGAEEYALIVHEDLEALHAVGEAKFLESTLNESAPYMAQRLANEIKE